MVRLCEKTLAHHIMLFILVALTALTGEELIAVYREAVEAHRNRDYDTALSKYYECTKERPNLAEANSNIAAILLSRGETDSAAHHWREAIRAKPDFATAHYNLAVLLSERGREDDLYSARQHCEQALEHRQDYVQALHLMGNILVSLRRVEEANTYYAKADRLAMPAGADYQGSKGSQAPPPPSPVAPSPFRWDGVRVGHLQHIEMPDGRILEMETLSMRPLSFLIRDYLSPMECDTLISIASPFLKASLVMGNAAQSERTSHSAFLRSSLHELLPELQERLAALVRLPLEQIKSSEDIQVVHYSVGQAFGVHHDSSNFQPRMATAFYYLSDVVDGGETIFPSAEGAMEPADALELSEPTRGGLVVKPRKGAALLFYNHDETGAIDPMAVHAGGRVMVGEKWGANHWVAAQ